MNDRFRMMLRAQCTYCDYKRLMHNLRIVWLRAYMSGAFAREFREEMEKWLPDWARPAATERCSDTSL